MSRQREKALAFHALHQGGRILVLPNAWDAASARVFELAGARAIATTSAGIAAALGHPDGEAVPRDDMLAVLARVVAAVAVPVSADVEGGYGDGVEATCETVRQVIAAGAVGINLEDGMREPRWLIDRIRAVRDVAERAGVPLFVNARTDVYLRGAGSAADRLADAVARLRAYEDAGADGLFAPGIADADAISRLVSAVRRPLNVLATAGVPPVAELERLGVARVSVGSGPMRATLALVRRIGERLLRAGEYDGFLVPDAPSHADVNAMFARPR
jgi:2-methylisocitrate lyase-like PEP mutase family enzyme